MSLDIVQSLWIGTRLSTMEQLAIRSFLDCGHPFHLYAYEPLDHVPEGTTLCDGREILPEDEIFVYQRGPGKGSPSAFSNFFRYKMLLERGGWWSDLDAVCMRPLVFDAEHVTGWEREPNGTRHLAAGLVKSPVGSAVAEYCWNACRSANKSKLRWGQVGPKLFSQATEAVGQGTHILEPEGFYPIDYWEVERLVCDSVLPTDCYSIHLWNSQWKKAGIDPDAEHPSDCLYEQLKRRFGVKTQRKPLVERPSKLLSAARASGKGSLWQSLSGLLRKSA